MANTRVDDIILFGSTYTGRTRPSRGGLGSANDRRINLTEIVECIVEEQSTGSGIPTLTQDPTDFTDPDTPRIWIASNEIRYWDGSSVQTLEPLSWASSEW